MELKAYVDKLEHLANDMPSIIEDILSKNAGTITGMLKLRLYNYGTDGNDDLIGEGEYAINTIERKKKIGQKTNIITLRDSGNMYSLMYLDVNKTDYQIYSKAPYAGRLAEAYGSAIFDLTNFQQKNVVENIIEPALQKYIDSNTPDFDISF